MMVYSVFMANTNRIDLRITDEQEDQLQWLMKETLRDRSGVIRWALAKAAKELGFVQKGKKKSGS